MAERGGLVEQARSGPTRPDNGPEVERSFGTADVGEPLPVAEGHDEDAARDEVHYPLAEPERGEFGHRVLTTGADPLEERLGDGAYAGQVGHGDAAFTDVLSPGDPLAMSAATAYAGEFLGRAQLAEIEALIGALPSAWPLAAPTRGLFPTNPSPQRGGDTVMESATPLDPHLGNPMPAAVMDTTKGLFDAGTLLGDDALYVPTSAGSDDGRPGSGTAAALGTPSDSDVAQGEPVLRIERMLVGGDDGDGADKLGAIASGGPTGTIASHHIVDEDVVKPRSATVTEPAPETSIALRTSDRRVEMTVADRDGSSGAAKPTDVLDATDGLAGAHAKPVVVDPAPTKPAIVDPPTDDERDAAQPDTDDETNDDVAAEAGPRDTAAAAIDDARSAEVALPTPSEVMAAGLDADDEDAPPFLVDPGVVDVSSLAESGAAPGDAAREAAAARARSAAGDRRSEAIDEARSDVPAAALAAAGDAADVALESAGDAADVDYPAAGPGVPSAVAEAVLAMLSPGPRGGAEATDTADGAVLVEDQLWLLPEVAPSRSAGAGDGADRYPLPLDDVDWNESATDTVPEGDAL